MSIRHRAREGQYDAVEQEDRRLFERLPPNWLVSLTGTRRTDQRYR